MIAAGLRPHVHINLGGAKGSSLLTGGPDYTPSIVLKRLHIATELSDDICDNSKLSLLHPTSTADILLKSEQSLAQQLQYF